MKLLTAFAICSCAWAQSGIDRPQLGRMLDANGAVRTVYGIAASVTLGEPEVTGVVSHSCSKTFCLVKTEANLSSPSGSVAAPDGPALIAFDGDAAYMWFPRSRQLVKWQNDVLTPIDSTIDGEVLSICAHAGSMEFVVRRRSGEWIVKSDGSVVDSLPRFSGPAMFVPGGVIYATRDEIAIRDSRIPLTHVTAFSWMSPGYVQVRAGKVDYVLRVEAGRETLFQLPAVQQ